MQTFHSIVCKHDLASGSFFSASLHLASSSTLAARALTLLFLGGMCVVEVSSGRSEERACLSVQAQGSLFLKVNLSWSCLGLLFTLLN